MKIREKKYVIALLAAICASNASVAGRVLDGTRVVSDEDAEWLKGEDLVSTSKFVRQTRSLEPEELAEIETLDLHGSTLGTSGFRKITDDLLPYLPNLKFLNLYISELRAQEDLELLASILERFGNLQYVNIVGNEIANMALSFVKEHEEQKELTDKFQKKVVFSYKTLLEDKFPLVERKKYDEWYKTHTTYYTLVH
ncbi:MAG: hypothetical protein K2P93_05055 [Alphaproteobacteria bacterium]|nr:hypothetical protein [Alphaproteobacteria bacterium]